MIGKLIKKIAKIGDKYHRIIALICSSLMLIMACSFTAIALEIMNTQDVKFDPADVVVMGFALALFSCLMAMVFLPDMRK